MTSHTDFLKFLQINFNFMKVLGLYPFTLNPHKRIVYSRIRNILIFLLRVILTILYLVTLSYVNEKTEPMRRIDLFWLSHGFLIIYVDVLSVVVIIVNEAFKSSSTKLLNDLIEINEVLFDLKIFPNYKKLYKIYLPMLVFEILIISSYSMGIVTGRIFTTKFKFDGYIFVAALLSMYFCYKNLINLSVSSSLYTTFLATRSMFTAIDLKLKRDLPFDNYLQLVRNTAKIHKRLCDVIKLANRILSPQLLFIIVFYFVMFTLHTFYVAAYIFERKANWYVIVSCLWISFCIFKCLTFIIVSTQCSKYVKYLIQCNICLICKNYRQITLIKHCSSTCEKLKIMPSGKR
jgi:hypothetical protein